MSGIETIGASSEHCAICGELAATHAIETQQFAYVDGEREYLLTASVPVVHCTACGESYAGEEAEIVQHEAVCRHLGRLTPGEIRGLRQRLGLSQAKLAEATGIGIASIKRWENGAVIQNASLDARLRTLETTNPARSGRPVPRFQTELAPELFEAARQFRLRPAYAMAA